MTSASTASQRRLMWAAIAAVSLVVAACAAVAILLPPARVRALARAQLAEALARDVRFRDASLGWWPPVRIDVHGLEIAEPGGFGDGAAFQVRALHLDLDVMALFGGRVRVRRLVLDRPTIHLVLRPDGTTNLDGLARPATPGRRAARPMDLELRELRIEGGRALIDAVRSGRRVTFGIESRVSLASSSGGTRVSTSGRTEITGLAFGPLSATRAAELNALLSRLRWRVEHRGAFDGTAKRLALERLALAVGNSELGLSGRIENLGPKARVDLRSRGTRVNLGEVLGFLAAADARAFAGIQGSGRLDFDLAIRGAMNTGSTPRLEGALAVTDGSFRYDGAPVGVRELAFRARFAPDTVSITNLAAIVGGTGGGVAPLRASLMITDFADPRVRLAVEGDLDLGAVSPLLAERDTRLGGRAKVAVRGQGRARDPGSMALEGHARLADVSVAAPSLPRKVEKVAGEIRFSRAQATVRALSLTAGQSSLKLDGVISRPLALAAAVGKAEPAQVAFTLRSPYLDLAELLPVTPGQPLLPNASGGGTVAIGRLRHQKLDVTNVTARIELTPVALEVTNYALHGYGGRVNGRAAFDLANPARPGFDVDARVDSVEADALLSAWTPARGWLHGALNTTIDLSGAGSTPDDLKRTLTAAGIALVSNGTLGPGPALEAVARATGMAGLKEVRFRDLRLPFRVVSGRMITDPVVLDGRHGRWQLAGGVGFDGSLDYAVSVTMPREVAAALGAKSALAAGALADDQGNLLLDLRITGSARAPRVAWDTRAMRDRVAGRLSHALTEQRAKLEEEARAGVAKQQKAAEDSARAALERARRAMRDSLERRAGGLLKGFFGSARDSTP